jgi:23S rRNA-/tRNA-specific pseudouridylate synthase
MPFASNLSWLSLSLCALYTTAETPDVVAVHKPATVPVHPTGQYRKNTVVGILAAERPELGRLLPVHRLDKNVSGLLLMVWGRTGR